MIWEDEGKHVNGYPYCMASVKDEGYLYIFERLRDKRDKMSATKSAARSGGGLRFVDNSGNFVAAGEYIFPAGSLSPRKDPNSVYAKHYPLSEPLSPRFEIFWGQQAHHLPLGVWIWEKYTIAEITSSEMAARKAARASESRVESEGAALAKIKRGVFSGFRKKTIANLERNLAVTTKTHENNSATAKQLRDLLLEAHKEKLALLRKQKTPVLA